MRPCNGKIFDIQHNSYVDGPGMRTTVFFSGCALRCRWCHNPESWTAEPKLLVYRDRCTACGTCAAICPKAANEPDGILHRELCAACGECVWACPADARMLCGKETDAETVLREVLRDRAYYTDGGGMTLSGGECLLQPEFAAALLSGCRDAGVTTAVDTAGHVPRENIEKVLPFTDWFLYDLKCADPLLHREGTGAGNEILLENLRFLLGLCPQKVMIRIPVIPGFNDRKGEPEAMANLLRTMPNPPVSVEVLPYHRMGENKFRALGREPECFAVPSPEAMAAFKAAFAGLPVR